MSSNGSMVCIGSTCMILETLQYMILGHIYFEIHVRTIVYLWRDARFAVGSLLAASRWKHKH